MFLRIGEVDRFRQPANQANDTFIKRECDSTTTRFLQSPGRHEVITTSIVIGQINRTDLCIHRKTDVGNQNIQRFIQTRSTGHLFDYFAQAGEHNLRSLTSFTSVRRCALRLRSAFLKRHDNTCEFFHHPAIDIAFK